MLELPKIEKKIKFEGDWGELYSKEGSLDNNSQNIFHVK